MGLLNIPLQYGNMGRGIGGDLGTAAAYGLKSRADAATGLANVRGVSPWGSTLSGLAGLFTTPKTNLSPAVTSIFNRGN